MTEAGKREGWVDVEFGHELLLERRIHPVWVVERGEGRSQFEVTKIVVIRKGRNRQQLAGKLIDDKEVVQGRLKYR